LHAISWFWHHAANERLRDHRGQAQRCPAFRGVIAAPLQNTAGVGCLTLIADVAATVVQSAELLDAFSTLETILLRALRAGNARGPNKGMKLSSSTNYEPELFDR